MFDVGFINFFGLVGGGGFMSEWVSVKDKQPPIGEWVLWLDGNKTMGYHSPFHHIDRINQRGECLVNYFHKYTHWMPLPEPPKETNK